MASEHPLNGVEALLFDVFGTVVDWRGSVAKELEILNPGLSNKGTSHFNELGAIILTSVLVFTFLDWDKFALEWRQGYYSKT